MSEKENKNKASGARDNTDSKNPREPDDIIGPDTMAGGDLQSLARIEDSLPKRLFVLPFPDIVLFPGMMVPIPMDDGPLLQIVTSATANSDFILFVPAKAGTSPNPQISELPDIGTTAKILKKIQLPDKRITLVVQGMKRSRPVKEVRRQPYLVADVEHLEDRIHDTKELDGLTRAIQEVVQKFVEGNPKIPNEAVLAALNLDSPGHLADFVISQFGLKKEEQVRLLAELNVNARLKAGLEFLMGELNKLEISKKIQKEIQEKIEKNQKEFFLREQLKAIRKELGEEKDSRSLASDVYEDRIKKAKMPREAEKRAKEELGRLKLLSPESAEFNVIRTYLDWLCDLPWAKTSAGKVDINRAQRILNRDHYGLEEVKNRILEFLAVRKLNAAKHGPILCLAGPPGVGKTSLGRSIAEALGRKFFRFSLGGMRDEAEIKGHRRTYVGAMPGKFLQTLKRIGTRDPLIMLDEIDKVGSDWRGDPSSALLEALDPEQNNNFLDHYLDVPFDLSQVFFITTANQLETIPRPLLDRMEVIRLSGYIVEEKVKIASGYLVPRQREENGINSSQISFSDAALKKIAMDYTREAGVRNLEREIGKVCRKIATKIAKGKVSKKKKQTITTKNVADYLGPPVFESEFAVRDLDPGVATGLAWTPFGGDILFIEASMMPGNGRFKLTGQLGDVMSESAQLAFSYVKSIAPELGIDGDMLKKHDFHVHFPAGAVPKDGPSAGVTIVTAIISLLTNRPLQPRLAMTGEITLIGNVLPVGGIREKVIAARHAGVKTIIMPSRNKKDLEKVPAY
ncbi:MAG: endopeptidase La, partial [Deltaproteobacteria bacterium]|nr:endopeptidase La [Deltaproteobacteria bacterium]